MKLILKTHGWQSAQSVSSGSKSVKVAIMCLIKRCKANAGPPTCHCQLFPSNWFQSCGRLCPFLTAQPEAGFTPPFASTPALSSWPPSTFLLHVPCLSCKGRYGSLVGWKSVLNSAVWCQQYLYLSSWKRRDTAEGMVPEVRCSCTVQSDGKPMHRTCRRQRNKKATSALMWARWRKIRSLEHVFFPENLFRVFSSAVNMGQIALLSLSLSTTCLPVLATAHWLLTIC